jgi:hypothetical protein
VGVKKEADLVAMKTINALIFIDANLYLPLYGLPQWKKLFNLLKEQKAYIFVSAQIVEEVQRNKLQVVAGLLANQLEHLKQSRGFNLPDYIFKDADAKLCETLRDLRKKQIQTDFMKAATHALQRISRSEDEVSKALAGLFHGAATHSPEELQRARDRRERGNAPGKPEDPLGDQLTWEQLLSQCKGKSKLWVISKDMDYYTQLRGEKFLNPLLYHDLVQVMDPDPEVFCFDSIDEGIRDFVRRTGAKAEKLPTIEESKEIEKGLDSLSPLSWLNTSMDDANMVALLARSRQMSPRLRHQLLSQGDENWILRFSPADEAKASEPDKTDK